MNAALKRERVTMEELKAAIRSAGVSDLDEPEAVIPETDESFSVLKQGTETQGSTLAGIKRPADLDKTAS